jgi:Family of unknown function (DUF6445)
VRAEAAALTAAGDRRPRTPGRSRVIDLNGQLRRHERCRTALTHVGEERSPVLVVDDFLSRPELLVELAATDCTFDGVTDAFYPGTRAAAPPIYCFAVRAFLGEAIVAAFSLGTQSVTRELAHFSLVTRHPSNLHPLQRMPHTDSFDRSQLAVLHYLCGPEHGGTSFYRHRRTGYEVVDEPRREAYQREVAAEFDVRGPPPAGYICGDDPGYERIASFEAAYNRVLVYRSVNLHSADIQPGFHFSDDPRRGRLTVNTFFFYG